MRAIVIGVKRMSGIGKESGNSYDMARLICIAPIDAVNNASLRIEGFGFEPAEIELAPEAIGQFAGIKFPAELELKEEARARRGQFVMYIVGLERPVVAKAVA